MSKSKLASLEKNITYAEKAYHELKRLIIYNRIKPRTVLNERELADQLGVSRTPVRDALQLLENEGWIEKDGKNKIVSPFTKEDVASIIEIRLPLEMLVLDLVKDKLQDAHVDHLESLIGEMKEIIADEEMELPSYLEKDIEFHTYMAEVTGNHRLARFYNNMIEQLFRAALIGMEYNYTNPQSRTEEHEMLLACYKSRDLEQAKRLLVPHIQKWADGVMKNYDRWSVERE